MQSSNPPPSPKGSNVPWKNPKPIYPRHNHPKWDIFWVSMITIMVILEYVFLRYLTIPLSQYRSLTIIAMVGLIVFFIWSTKMVADGISFAKQPICYMGATKGRRSGASNKKALGLLILFTVFFAMNNFLLIHFYTNYFNPVDVLIGSRILLFISSIVVVMMALVPVDIHEMKHGYMSLVGFIITQTGSILSAAYFIRERINFPWAYIAFVIEMLLAVGYIWGFITRYRYAALMQKICILFSAIAIALYLTYFASVAA